VVAREHPEIWGGLIDLDPTATPREGAQILLGELTRRDGEDQVCYRANQRLVARIVRCEKAPRRPVGDDGSWLRGDATYLITGGLGGLGLSVARWMGERGAKSLVLVSRSADSTTGDPVVMALRERGVNIFVARADVSRQEEMAGVLRTIADALPPLRGVIHAAGVLEDGVLLAQDWPRFEKVFAAKVAGTWNLHQLTHHVPLDFFVLFSSVAALLGPPGQSNHAAANAFEDAVAQWRRARGLPALSINWGPWGTVGAAAVPGSVAKSLWDAQGIEFFAPEEGLDVLGSALSAGVTQQAALRVTWSRFIEQFAGATPPVFSELAGGRHVLHRAMQVVERQTGALADRWAAIPDADRPEFVLRSVQRSVAATLGHRDLVDVDISRPLMELGVDSLMAVELKKSLEREWSLEGRVPATMIFKYPTIGHVAEFIRGLLDGDASKEGDATTPIGPQGELPEPAEAGLSEASDDEVKRLLVEELRSLSAEFRDEERA
jgi:NAD(P)-dependent dehydrogenase (short-subunit alcohol dehydrogenase family)/acyl carrier protein